jgi:uncharacterized RDD family membrane protein YckC
MAPESTVEQRFCSQCGQPAAQDDLAHFGDVLVCASCKDIFVQKLREGVTPGLSMAYAGFWVRFAAAFIDGAILFVVQFALQMAFLPIFAGNDPVSLLVFSMFLNLFNIAMAATYEGVLIARYAATPGKMALGLQVVRADGSPVALSRAVARYFAKMASALIVGIGYIMIAFDSQKRGLHDHMCETRVVKAS